MANSICSRTHESILPLSVQYNQAVACATMCAHLFSDIKQKSSTRDFFPLSFRAVPCSAMQRVCVCIFFSGYLLTNKHTHKESGKVSLEIENIVIAFPLETSLTVFMCGYTHRDIHAELQTDTQTEDSQKQI